MSEIKLNRSWELGEPIGDPGGFGRICAATGEGGTEAVVKLVKKDPGADRELLFESLAGVPHVVPILDSGEWEDQWVLVMRGRPVRFGND